MKTRLIYVLLSVGISLVPIKASAQKKLKSQNLAMISTVVKNREPLGLSTFYPLPLTSIKPQGWLRRQLQIQADGLTGHLDEFWPDVGPNSGWLGGTGESWERGPYYMDGLIPLAYLLDDPRLIAKAKKWVDWTISHQRRDGAIGPPSNKDWWPNMIMLKVLTQYQEATGDARVIPLMKRYFEYHLREASSRPLKEWAIYRWGDELLSVIWLYNRTGDPELLKLARVLHEQGFDWKQHYENFPFTSKTGRETNLRPDMRSHGVNIAMALKYSPLWSLISGDETDRRAIYQQLNLLDKYHLLPNGIFSADEHLAGLDPTQGTELCAVVEAMFSLEHLTAILGDPVFGDRLEKIGYNALPGALTADMWAHQYDQQPNQVLCDIRPRSWSTNGPESNVFGLEPNFGCCTANLHQGWPKLAASLWMASNDNGLAAIVYAPNTVRTVINGIGVSVIEDTEYPFRERVSIKIDPDLPVRFPLYLRIPQWADRVTIVLNGKGIQGIRAGTFYRIEREWAKGDKIDISFPMQLRISRWYRNSVVIERGPLVYALKIGEVWRRITTGMKKPAPQPAADWEVYPTTPWNYGLIIDPNDINKSVEVIEKPIGDYPFSPTGAPVELRVKARRIPDWTLINGSAGPLPVSPVISHEPEETVTLIPYGAAKLRITAFPQLAW